jgi:large subunit ribosomal protein L25
MKTVSIIGEARASTGKRNTKDLRNKNHVPCVLYGGNENIHFSALERAFKPILTTPDLVVAQIEVEGKTYQAILKDSQFDPIKDKPLHLDFQELVPGHAVNTELPIRLTGMAIGVKAGGRLLQKVRKLLVKAMPESLVSEIIVGVEHLDVGKSIRVRDIQLPGVQILNSPALPIASVEITRAIRSAQAAAAATTGKK